MNFDNRVITTVEIFGTEVWITETIINTWIIMAFLIILALILRSFLKNFDEVPKGIQNVIEAIVEIMDNFVIETMGKENRVFGNWFFGIFIFILASNLSGLFNLRPPTADISTTFALSISTFVIIQFVGLKSNTKYYFKSFLEPWPVFLPVNIISEFSIPISLGFRLMGNILGGLIILGIVYYLLPFFLTIGIPSFLHAYFDVFSGGLQAFIFTVLSMTFISGRTSK